MSNKEGQLAPHPRAEEPTEVWKEMESSKHCEKVPHLPLNTPISPHQVRFVYMTDTHENVEFPFEIPDGDVFVYGGDISKRGKVEAIVEFEQFLSKLPHKHKIVIVGNHELTMDPKAFSDKEEHREYNEALGNKWTIDVEGTKKYLRDNGMKNTIEILSKSPHCTLLHDTTTHVYGISIYGSPWSPEFSNMAFNLKRGKECFDKWQEIPTGVDVLMTHSPPLGYGDFVPRDQRRAGCVDLLNIVQNRVKPKYHLFGHIHEGYGVYTDGTTTYINASTMTVGPDRKPANPPIIFDLPLPAGVTKDA